MPFATIVFLFSSRLNEFKKNCFVVSLYPLNLIFVSKFWSFLKFKKFKIKGSLFSLTKPLKFIN